MLTDLAMVVTLATPGLATLTTDTDTTSVMLSQAMDTAPAMVMEDMVMGATLMCIELHKDLVHRTHPADM